jgi:hypothetical protein
MASLGARVSPERRLSAACNAVDTSNDLAISYEGDEPLTIRSATPKIGTTASPGGVTLDRSALPLLGFRRPRLGIRPADRRSVPPRAVPASPAPLRTSP